MYAPDADRLDSGPLQLRLLRPGDDLRTYAGWLHDADIVRYLEVRFAPPSPGSLPGYVQAMYDSPGNWLWGIYVTEGHRHIGNIKLGDYNPHHRTADVGLLIGERAEWGKGYATRSIVAVADYAFRHTDIVKLTAGMYATNEGSYRAFLRAGFVTEGRRLSQYVDGGQRVDGLLVGITHDQWAARTPARGEPG